MDRNTQDQKADEFYDQTYDDSVPDWPGQIDFYRMLADRVKTISGLVLEIACGTGRVAIRLAKEGVNLVGLGLSPVMLEITKRKSPR